MCLLCDLIEILWYFTCGYDECCKVNKYYFGFANFDFLNCRFTFMVLINQAFEEDEFIGIFSSDASFPYPKDTRLNDGSYTDCLEEEVLLIDDCIKSFNKAFDHNEKQGYSQFAKSVYKYKPEELVKKIILCFEANKDDVPFDSKIYHSDSFQKILAKANALREYAEDKGVLEPLSEGEKRSKYKVVPVEEAKL